MTDQSISLRSRFQSEKSLRPKISVSVLVRDRIPIPDSRPGFLISVPIYGRIKWNIFWSCDSDFSKNGISLHKAYCVTKSLPKCCIFSIWKRICVGTLNTEQRMVFTKILSVSVDYSALIWRTTLNDRKMEHWLCMNVWLGICKPMLSQSFSVR